MRLISARLACCAVFGLLGLVASGAPARAGDLSNGAAGGIRDYGNGGIPVPAPMPYEETTKFYLRADVGTPFKSQGTLGNSGMPVNIVQPNDWREQSILSFGFGRYVTPSIRTELTFDYHAKRSVVGKNTNTADAALTATNLVGTDNNVYHGVQNEDIDYQNSTLLVSAFYDFNSRGRLRPYVGAGVGLGRHQLSRSGVEVYNCDPTVSTSTAGAACAGAVLPTTYTAISSGSSTGYGLAAQVSAGLSYDLSPRVHWDSGYRMLWQGAHVAVMSSGGINSVDLGNHLDHEIRTGVRWDIW